MTNKTENNEPFFPPHGKGISHVSNNEKRDNKEDKFSYYDWKLDLNPIFISETKTLKTKLMDNKTSKTIKIIAKIIKSEDNKYYLYEVNEDKIIKGGYPNIEGLKGFIHKVDHDTVDIMLKSENQINVKQHYNLNKLINDHKKLLEFKEVLAKEYDNDTVKYLRDRINPLAVDETDNILKLHLTSIGANTGRYGGITEVHGGADTGKTYIMELEIDYLRPSDTTFRIDDLTYAYFTRLSSEDINKKVVYLGDQGDEETASDKDYKRFMKAVKVLATEGAYKRGVVENNKDNGHETVEHELKATTNLRYSTVYENQHDQQITSRGIHLTPVEVERVSKIRFMTKKDQRGTKANYKFNKAVNELENYKLHYNQLINQFNEDKNNIEFLNPFVEYTFNNVTELSETDTRAVNAMSELFKSYMILQHEKCFKFNKTVNKEEIIYYIPRLEDVQNFISLMQNNVGLKKHEIEFLLMFKEIGLIPITEEDMSEKVKEKENDCQITNKYDDGERTDNIKLIKELLENGGLSIETLDEKYLFRVTDLRKWRGKKAYRDVQNVSEKLIDLYGKGFLGKLEIKDEKKNVYYLNKEMFEKIRENYKITKKDVEMAINKLRNGYYTNPGNEDPTPLFDKNEIEKISYDYYKAIKANK